MVLDKNLKEPLMDYKANLTELQLKPSELA